MTATAHATMFEYALNMDANAFDDLRLQLDSSLDPSALRKVERRIEHAGF